MSTEKSRSLKDPNPNLEEVERNHAVLKSNQEKPVVAQSSQSEQQFLVQPLSPPSLQLYDGMHANYFQGELGWLRLSRQP